MPDQKATSEWTGKCRYRADDAPHTQCAPTALTCKDAIDNGHGLWHLEGRTHALHGTRRNEHFHCGRHGTRHRTESENSHTQTEHPALAQNITQAAGKEQRHHHSQQIGRGYPHGVVYPCVQLALQVRQRHRHHGLVQQGYKESEGQCKHGAPCLALGRQMRLHSHGLRV